MVCWSRADDHSARFPHSSVPVKSTCTLPAARAPGRQRNYLGATISPGARRHGRDAGLPAIFRPGDPGVGMQADRILVRLRRRRFARRDDPLPRRFHVTGVRGIGSQRSLSPPAKALRATGLWTRSDAGRRMRARWSWGGGPDRQRTDRSKRAIRERYRLRVGRFVGRLGIPVPSAPEVARSALHPDGERGERGRRWRQRPGRETPFVPGNSLS